MKFPGYTHLIGPEALMMPTPEGVRRVKSNHDYRVLHELTMRESNARAWVSPEKCVAEINHGRWLAHCVWCTGAMTTRPDWGAAYCWTCGARYEHGAVIFPEDERIMQLLLLRPNPKTQNWDNKQTADDLLRENEQELHL